MAVQGTVASRSTVGELLKLVYDDEVRDLRAEAKVLKYFQSLDTVKLDGEDFVIDVQITRNNSSQATDISSILPDSGQAKFKQGKLRIARNFQPLQIDNELIMLAGRDVATFSNRVAILMQDAKNNLLKDLNRQSLGDGTATLATLTGNVTGGSATATVAVDSTQFFEEDEVLDIFTSTFSASRLTPPAYAKVNSIDSDTQITISMVGGGNVPSGIVSGDKVTKAKNRTTSTVYEMNGLRKIASTGDSFMGIDGATVRRWNGNKYDAGGAPLGLLVMGKAMIQGKRKVEALEKDQPDVIFTSPEQALAATVGANGTFPDVRYTRGDVTKLGAAGLNKPTVNFGWGDITLESDLDVGKTEMFAFNKAATLYGELHPVKMEDWDGVSVLPATDTSSTVTGIVAAQKSWLVARCNVGCVRRNAFTWLYNLSSLT